MFWFGANGQWISTSISILILKNAYVDIVYTGVITSISRSVNIRISQSMSVRTSTNIRIDTIVAIWALVSVGTLILLTYNHTSNNMGISRIPASVCIVVLVLILQIMWRLPWVFVGTSVFILVLILLWVSEY